MKKSILFSGIAVLIAWFVIVTNKVNSENYSEEFQQAYDFAYKNGITTTNSIDKAQMNSPLTRIAMAKMLSQFAMNVLWKTPNNSIVPAFSDVPEELNEKYWWAVDLAYQLWIMWINMKNNEFRPHASVTRAEFGTALSRMLYGLEDGNPYYTTHLKKLKEEWIITNDNPSIKEKRWYVMLMLMRSQNNESKTKLSTSEISNLKTNWVIYGSENAKITVLEFADASCSFCKRQIWQNKTIDNVMAQYPNDVNVIFKNFPIFNETAAQAMACAEDYLSPKNYHEYVIAVFQTDNATSIDALANLASNYGADATTIANCVNNGEKAEEVNTTMSEGKTLGIIGAPSSVIINNESGEFTIIPGAYPVEDFIEAISKLLS